MERKASEILFKSEVHPYYRRNFKYIIISSIILSVMFSFIWGLNLIGTISQANLSVNFLGYIISLVIAIFVISLFIWIAIQWHRSYLIIYKDGIKVARPIKTLRHNYIPWEKIRDIGLFYKGRMMISGSMSYWTSAMHNIKNFKMK